MIYTKEPKNFNPRFEIVSCFFENEGTFLLLHRLPTKSEANKWGVPGGKVEPKESLEQAIIREVQEETGINITKQELVFIEKLYVRYETHDFIYNMFKTQFVQTPTITLRNTEHNGYVWVSPSEALKMDLITDMAPCIERVYNLGFI